MTTLTSRGHCWRTPILASPKLRTASASHRQRSIGTSPLHEPRISRVFEIGTVPPLVLTQSRRCRRCRPPAAAALDCQLSRDESNQLIVFDGAPRRSPAYLHREAPKSMVPAPPLFEKMSERQSLHQRNRWTQQGH